jgi:hypothetical protein
MPGSTSTIGAHARGAVQDRLLQRPFRPRPHILDGESGLQRPDAFHRGDVATLFPTAALDDARLVEMDMRLNQPGTGEAAAGIEALARGAEPRRDGGNAPAGNADIDRLLFRRVAQPCVANNEIHEPPPGEAWHGSDAQAMLRVDRSAAHGLRFNVGILREEREARNKKGETMTAVPLGAASQRRRLEAVVAGVIGNVLEWYDFAVYGYFVPVISQLFFPSTNEYRSLLTTLVYRS